MPDEERDEELVAQFLAGNKSAFGELVRRHEDHIYALAFRMTGNRSDALDATQETFVSAFRQARSFRGESSFGTWLYRVGMNACRDLLRKRGRAWGRQEEAPGDRPDLQTRVEEDVSLRIDLARALARLPEENRIAVVMHDVGGFPYEEIARVTQTQVGTVKSRISRGRRRLAQMLEQPTGAEASKEKT